jgi:hypothetical protein
MSSIRVKSFILDLYTNWYPPSSRFGTIRSIEFFFNEVKYLFPGATGLYTIIDSSKDDRPVRWCVDTDLSVTGSSYQTQWKSDDNAFDSDVPFRIIIVFSSPIEIDKIVLNNGHQLGGDTIFGVKDIAVGVSEQELVSGDAAVPISPLSTLPGATEIFNGQVLQHIASDVRDDQILDLDLAPPLIVNASLGLYGGVTAEVPYPKDVNVAAAIGLYGGCSVSLDKAIKTLSAIGLHGGCSVRREIKVQSAAHVGLYGGAEISAGDVKSAEVSASLGLNGECAVEVEKQVISGADIGFYGWCAIMMDDKDCRLPIFNNDRWC